MAGSIALGLSHVSSWSLCYWVFDIRYDPQLGISALMVLAAVALVVIVGLAASVGILRQKPIAFLREQNGE